MFCTREDLPMTPEAAHEHTKSEVGIDRTITEIAAANENSELGKVAELVTGHIDNAITQLHEAEMIGSYDEDGFLTFDNMDWTEREVLTALRKALVAVGLPKGQVVFTTEFHEPTTDKGRDDSVAFEIG